MGNKEKKMLNIFIIASLCTNRMKSSWRCHFPNVDVVGKDVLKYKRQIKPQRNKQKADKYLEDMMPS